MHSIEDIMRFALALLFSAGVAGGAVAQVPESKPVEMGQMDHGDMAGMNHGDMAGMDHGDMAGMDHGGMAMTGLLGGYAMSREASGTSWQPEAAGHSGIHMIAGDWML